ncbi:peroxide stress protein YaaA [Marinimicrobium alkaliphilum]|uniref:peroxide stress protein YaaA n=1 Tax=Marinimicrobium alkaliphilum TaxID=2202654 RepID=UPI000DBA7012|nr:peroxide stress protein YaaA [Marinimicrobium alkaliphilum]
MLLLISPAKTLDFETPPVTDTYSQADFLRESEQLITQLRHLAPQDISDLMGISDKLGQLNYDRFAQWHAPFTPDNAKQAVLAFKGDVYTGLDAENLSPKALAYAQDHLRILSGLYGLLRPLDLIQPYRLEMGTKFANDRGKDLYTFWGEQITAAINAQLAALGSRELVNLASNEYFKAVKPKQVEADIITPVFKDRKNGQYKIISFYAKKARGMMSAWAARKQVKKAQTLKNFADGGYAYNEDLSKGNTWVYTRDNADE